MGKLNLLAKSGIKILNKFVIGS